MDTPKLLYPGMIPGRRPATATAVWARLQTLNANLRVNSDWFSTGDLLTDSSR